MAEIDALVVGAGVVGLATGRALARAGLSTIIVDGERQFGSWTSSRNSEVIHAGIYYPQGSLKASLCVRGRALLYDFCATHGVPHRRLGKLIFAAHSDQTPALDAIAAAAETADVRDLVRLDAAAARRLEPELDVYQALLSPSTGIIDAHRYMEALIADAEDASAVLALNNRIVRLDRDRDEWTAYLDDASEPAVRTRFVVNACGLTAHRLAACTEGLDRRFVPNVHYARGAYFTYSGRVPFRHLIYPVPVAGGLGTHLTLDMSGAARFGPDVEWIDDIAYAVDPNRKASFLTAARLIWPDIEGERLTPGYSGIRPKLSGPSEVAADFRIDGPRVHGLSGLVNLFGIESPGLTSSLALAQMVLAELDIPATEFAPSRQPA